MNRRTTKTLSLVFGGLAAIAVVSYLTLFAPANFRGSEYLFAVESGQGVQEIIRNLEENGFLRSELGGRISFRLTNSRIIQAGTYNISPRMNAWQVAAALKKGQTAGARTTIPEGFTRAQIYERLEAAQIASVRDLISAESSVDLSQYEFLPPAGAKVKDRFEGFLFPDTYDFNRGMPASQILQRMLNNFEARTSPLFKEQPVENLTASQMVTLASLIEKEARTEEDRKLIAGVLVNRIQSGMRLDVDATVRFITNNWTKPITAADLAINSPYNTRLNAGLPPGPICNPGIAALNAAFHPVSHDYLYYLTDSDGITHYAKTLEEHNINKAKYIS